jgi:hypothetical protein
LPHDLVREGSTPADLIQNEEPEDEEKSQTDESDDDNGNREIPINQISEHDKTPKMTIQ